MSEPFGQQLHELIRDMASALIEEKVAAQEAAVRAMLPWPLRRASRATVRRFPWLFRWWMRRWEIVENLDSGEWRVQRKGAPPPPVDDMLGEVVWSEREQP